MHLEVDRAPEFEDDFGGGVFPLGGRLLAELIGRQCTGLEVELLRG